jgi:hypothetical protein
MKSRIFSYFIPHSNYFSVILPLTAVFIHKMEECEKLGIERIAAALEHFCSES